MLTTYQSTFLVRFLSKTNKYLSESQSKRTHFGEIAKQALYFPFMPRLFSAHIQREMINYD